MDQQRSTEHLATEGSRPDVPQTAQPEREYLHWTRDQWAALGASIDRSLEEDELERLRGINEPISVDEVATMYLPVATLLHLHIESMRQLQRDADRFLQVGPSPVPFVLGVTGSVAVGKSTIARVLQALLSRWAEHPHIGLVTTDSFLFPNAVLEERGLMARKGFPESYDVHRLARFVQELKSGRPEVHAPVYSHQRYDIVPDELQTVRRPDVVILEGLNIFGKGTAEDTLSRNIADLLDFGIYIDADEQHIIQWFVQRFMRLRDTAFQDPNSYFHTFAALEPAQAIAMAMGFWNEINGVNLRLTILPTRERAHMILHKNGEHAVDRVLLRRF